MAYLVKIMPRAQRDLGSLFQWIAASSSDTAHAWYRGLKQSILSLRDHPDRHQQTAENKELRHLLYGSRKHIYRVIYRVVEKRNLVEILHIRHAARQAFEPDDLKDR